MINHYNNCLQRRFFEMFPVKKNVINLLLINIKILFNKKIEFVKFETRNSKMKHETRNSKFSSSLSFAKFTKLSRTRKSFSSFRVSSFSSFWPVKFTDVSFRASFSAFLNISRKR